jgi:hypothetical protein
MTMAHVMMLQRNHSVDSMPSMGTEATSRISNKTGHSQKESGEVRYATFDSPTSPGEETRNNTLVDNSFHHEIYEELPHIQQPKAEATSELGEEFTMDLKDESKDVSSSGRRGRSSSRKKNRKDSSSSSSRSKSRSSSGGSGQVSKTVGTRSKSRDSKTATTNTASSSTRSRSKERRCSKSQDAKERSRSKSKDAKSSSRSKSKDSKDNSSSRSKSKDHKKTRIRREGSKKSTSSGSDASSLAQPAPASIATVEDRMVQKQKQQQTANDILGLPSPIRAKSLHQGPGQDSTEGTLLRCPMPTKALGNSDHGVPLTLWDMKQKFKRDFSGRPMPSDVALRQRYRNLPMFSPGIRTREVFPAHQYSPPNTNRGSLTMIQKVASDRWCQDESFRSARSSFTMPATMDLPPLQFTEPRSDRVVPLAEPTQASPVTLNSFMDASGAMSVGGEKKSVNIPWLFNGKNDDEDDGSVDESFIQCLDAFDEAGNDFQSSFDIAPHRPKRCDSCDESDNSLNSSKMEPTSPTKKQPIPESPSKSPTSLKKIVSKVKSVVLREDDNNERPGLNSSKPEQTSPSKQQPIPESPSKSPRSLKKIASKVKSVVLGEDDNKERLSKKKGKTKTNKKSKKTKDETGVTENSRIVGDAWDAEHDGFLSPKSLKKKSLFGQAKSRMSSLHNMLKADCDAAAAGWGALDDGSCSVALHSVENGIEDDDEEDEKEEDAVTTGPKKVEEEVTKSPKKSKSSSRSSSSKSSSSRSSPSKSKYPSRRRSSTVAKGGETISNHDNDLPVAPLQLDVQSSQGTVITLETTSGEMDLKDDDDKKPRRQRSASKSDKERRSRSRSKSDKSTRSGSKLPSESPKSKHPSRRRSSKIAKEGETISNHDNDLPVAPLQLDMQSSQGTVVTLPSDSPKSKHPSRRRSSKIAKGGETISNHDNDLPVAPLQLDMQSSQRTAVTLETTTGEQSASKSDKERRRSRSKVSSSESRSSSHTSRSCSPGTLRSDKHKKRQTRSRSPGALRGDIARKRETMREFRAKRHSPRDTVKEEGENSTSKFSPSSSVSSRKRVLSPGTLNSKRVVSPGTLNIRSASPEREMADFDPCNESLEDLLKKVKQKAKDLRAEKAKLGDAQHRLSFDESSLPAAFRRNSGQPALHNMFTSSLEW